jgi:hypothetical protein
VYFQGPSGEVITVNVERRVKARGRDGYRQRTERELEAVAGRKVRSIVLARRPWHRGMRWPRLTAGEGPLSEPASGRRPGQRPGGAPETTFLQRPIVVPLAGLWDDGRADGFDKCLLFQGIFGAGCRI